MHFFSFKMSKEVRSAYKEARHEYLLFGRTRERAQDGTCVCVIIGSSSDVEALRGVAVEHAYKIDVEGKLLDYFIHPVRLVEQGITLGEQELKAGDN